MRDDLNHIFRNQPNYESQYQMALESLAEGVAICSPIHDPSGQIEDFTYLYINSALAAMTKLSKEDMTGRRMSEIMPGFFQSQLFSMCKETFELREPRTIKSEHVKEEINSQGLEGYYDFTITYFEHGVVITIHDVTDSRIKELELKHSADLLTKSEEDFRLLFENSFDALFLTEPGGRIIRCNKAAEKIFGYSAEEICSIGRDRITDTTDPNWQKALSERERTGKFVGQLRYKRKDGTVFTGECSSILFKTSDGSLRTSMVVRDITGMLRSEQMLKKTSTQLQNIIDGSSSIIFVKDLDGRFILINRKMEELLGISSEEIKGRTDFEMLPKELAEYFRAQDMKVISRGKSVLFEEEADIFSKHKYLLTNKFPLLDEDGKPYAICGIGTDVSELRKTVEALKRSNNELEQFAYVASHDLQEPLRMISSYTRMLEIKYNDILDEKAKEYINFIIDGAKRMNLLIRDLLSFARITTQAQPFGKCQADIILKEVLHDLQLAISESGAGIKYEKLPEIYADPLQIKQLFQNLIANAIKFSGKNKPEIIISAELKGSEWVFSVRDDGIGISREHFDEIFQFLRRLHTREEYPGTGIGLALCKKIVERHGGRIWVESAEGEGSTFYFTIPKIISPMMMG